MTTFRYCKLTPLLTRNYAGKLGGTCPYSQHLGGITDIIKYFG
jgi:hypothetical protein